MSLAGRILIAYLLVQILGVTFCQVGPQSPFFHENEGRGPTTINIIGAFTRKSSAGAEAARIAVKDVNSCSSRVNLNISFNLTETEDTECNPHKVRSALSFLNAFPPTSTHSVILAGCHEDCYTIAEEFSPSVEAIMCYGLKNSTSTVFDERPYYPGLLFLSHEMLSVPLGLANFVRHVGWEKVAVLSSAVGNGAEIYVTMADHFASILSQHLVQASHFDISVDNSVPLSQIFQDLDRLQEMNFRIMFVFGDELVSQMLLCQIYRRRLYDPNTFVWFFVGPSNFDLIIQEEPGFSPGLNCTSKQLIKAAEGHFTAYPSFWNPNGQEQSVSLKTSNEVRAEVIRNLQRAGKDIMADFNEAAFAYDAVWTAATLSTLSIFHIRNQNAAFSLCNFHFPGQANGFLFPGVSGPVSFQDGKRSLDNAIIRIERYRDRKYNLVALSFNSNGTLHWLHGYPFQPVTPGDGSFEPPLVPKNSALSKYQLEYLFELLISICSALIISKSLVK